MAEIRVAEQFDRLWRDKYPFVVSTLGTLFPQPAAVEQRLGLRLARLPVPHHGFALWYFRSWKDREDFVHALPSLLRRSSVMPRAT